MATAEILKMINTAQAYSNKQERNNAKTQFTRQKFLQRDAQKFNKVEAEKNRQFQLNMSNTAHQREILDLQKAGINPILSANNGASTTSGAQASSGEGSASKADTDMQKAGLVINWLMNKQNNAQQLKIAKLNNANALKMAQVSAAASMYGANQSLAGQIASAQASRYSTDKNYASSIYGIDRSFASSKYASDIGYAQSVLGANATRYASRNSYLGALASANATRFAAGVSAGASKYASDNSLLNNREQREWNSLHPNNKYQAGGSVIEGVSKLIGNYTANSKRYSPGNSSAK